MSVVGWRRWLRLGVGLALLALVYFLAPRPVALGRSELTRLVLAAVVMVVLTLLVVWQVRLQLTDESRQVDGLLFVNALSIVVFALAFYTIASRSPGQIPGLETKLDALYFTLSTLLTIGYGDIHAAGQFARGFVVVQMVFNVAIIATAAAALNRRVREKALERARERASMEPEHRDRGRRAHGRDTHRKPT